ncbi:MAG: ATPase, T2SS/T4P/T4SS family [Planctomycetota bacterium]
MAGLPKMLGEILIENGVVTQVQIAKALEVQMQQGGKRIGEILVEQGVVDEEEIIRALAEQFDLPVVDLNAIEIPKTILREIPQEIARQNKVVPIESTADRLVVAIADPLDLGTLDNLRFMTNKNVEANLATSKSIMAAIDRVYGVSEDQVDQMLEKFTEDQIDFKLDSGEGEGDGADDAPIIKLVTMIMVEALKQRASDIHVEPMAGRVRVRYRVDGVCYEVESPPKRLQNAVLSRIKLMAGMDIAEKRKPQDGRIKIKLINREIDMRVSALPSVHGESIVMRLLDKENLLLDMSHLGFEADNYETWTRIIRRPNGIILVTGPTGSGKTTTLYSALAELNLPDRKIITAENPVEYHLDGINQCQVRHEIGLDFARILRAMLRQAPQIILVGEIRDDETAEIAIQAALTGHLVFSTLHTNDAPSAITRLTDMGVRPFLVASSIQAILAQRLMRVICPNCREPYEPDISQVAMMGLSPDQLAGRVFYHGRGCDQCGGHGYRGRKAVFELMVMNSALKKMAFDKLPSNLIRKEAISSGMRTLFQDGIRKVLAGVTTIEEILRIAAAN